jgi:hypothetical protein
LRDCPACGSSSYSGTHSSEGACVSSAATIAECCIPAQCKLCKRELSITTLWRANGLRANEVRLQLSVLAYNLGNLWRRLVLPTRIDAWSLTSLQQRLVKTGGRLVKHPRYYWLLPAESQLTRRLFGTMLRRIWALPVPSG